MEFIDNKEFLELNNATQTRLLQWVSSNIEDNDLVINGDEIMLYKDYLTRSPEKIDLDSYALFTELLSRRFIESRFGENVKVELEWSNDGYIVNVVSEINDERVYKSYYTLELEPIKAYWYAVLEIAREEI